ncbi:MAG: DNA-directed RNA polymerase subunit beta', partial [Planctomycetaceae bacterium]
QNMVVTQYDCETTQGITRGVVYRGEKVEVSLADAIRGRVSRTNIVNPITDEVIVRDGELITVDVARKIEKLGLEKLQARSPMTCEAPLGMCRLCYGMDLSTGALVEEGMAVGIIAAQSIGEPGTQLTMRTFHGGGTAFRDVEENEIKTKRAGRVKLARIRSVVNSQGQNVVLARNGEVIILDPKERELERYTIPNGAVLLVNENDEIKIGQVICQWDPLSVPILAEVAGKVRYEDFVEGDSIRSEVDASGTARIQIIEHKGDLHPQIMLENAQGKVLDFYFLPEKAIIEVSNGQMIMAGTVIAKTPRELGGTQDITSGLPRVTELFEARKPKEPAIIAEIDGGVDLLAEKKRGKRVIVVRSPDGKTEKEYIIPHGKHLRVHAKDMVRCGDALVDGPLVPHDILRVSGEEAVQQYLLREIQNVYRSQRVEIDDKHIEIIISQMLRKVRVDNVGDTSLLPGIVIDRFELRKINEQLMNCVRITETGDSEFHKGDVVPRHDFDETNAQIEAAGGTPAKSSKPKPATASP